MRSAMFLFVLLAACASGGGTVPPNRAILETADGVIRSSGDPTTQMELQVPVDTAFSLIKAAYIKMGIELKTLDPVARRLGNSNFILRREFAGEPLSAYVNCGNSYTGPLADRARVFLSLISTVDARPGGARVSTRLEATAQDISSSSDRMACATTGKFEGALQKAVEHIADVRASTRPPTPAQPSPR